MPASPTSESAFALEDVTRAFASTRAVDAVTLSFARGQTAILIGSSGSGKSTVLRLLLGLEWPDTGNVRCDGEPLRRGEVAQLRRRVGYVIQDGGLFPHLTVLGNLALLPRHLGWVALAAAAAATTSGCRSERARDLRHFALAANAATTISGRRSERARDLRQVAHDANAATTTSAPVVVIGSKNFTESVVLGEIARLAARGSGVRAEHRRSLGGTRILWRALLDGDIDAYPEYTGTISHELLHDVAPNADIATLRARLAKLGVGITDSLGFNNTYALGMREGEAGKLHIRTISDLAGHPDLKLAFSNEFMNRADGWPGLKKTYGLPMNARGMDHALAYRALAAGAIDVTDLYRTDAEIAYYHLRVLQDDHHYFPRYDAVYLYRLDLQQRASKFVAALDALAGSIDAAQMRAMNKAVKIDGQTETAVAARFLGVQAQSTQRAFWPRLGRYTLQHLALVSISMALAILLAVPLGILAARQRQVGQLVLGLTGILQTVPSLALFVFMIPLFGIGAKPAIAALFLYSLLPIVRNTHAGLTGISPSLLESAAALGLPSRVRLWRIELPLALRSILAGVKIAVVINVGTATLGALIGAGGYGQPILTGIRLDDVGLIMQGAIPAALLALAMQGIFELIERVLTPRGLRLRAAT